MNPETREQSARDLCRIGRGEGLLAAWDGVPGLGAILVAGPEAASFLQTQLTSDVHRLSPGQGQWSARLTRTGALVAHFGLHRLPDRGQPFASFLILLPAVEVPSLLTDLQGHLVSEDVFLEDAGDEFQGLVVQGPGSSSLLEVMASAAGSGAMILEQSFTGDPGWVALAPAAIPAPWQQVSAEAHRSGFAFLDEQAAGSLAWDWLRMEAGRPLAGVDFNPGRTLLPQTGLEHQTVSATKGCYLGQEVVARVRAYGSVPRALRGLVIKEPRSVDLESLPPAGDPLKTIEGETIGTWATSGYSVVWDRPAALAYLDRDHRTPGLLLQLESGELELEAEVILLPLFAAASGTERAATLYDQAVRLFSAGADGEAVSLLQEAIGLDPSLTEAYEALGVVLGRTGRFHEAIDVFKRLEELVPDEPMVHTNLSLYYMKIGDKDEAERQKAIATMQKFGADSDEDDLFPGQQIESDSRRLDAERRRGMFGDVLAVDPDDGLALMGMGQALLDLEDHAGADEYLARALGLEPDNSPLYVSRGKVLELMGRISEAADVYRQGVTVASRKGDLMPLKELEHRLFLLADPG